MLFSQIPGHKEEKERLIRSVQEHRVSHAQLFLGPVGSGNLALALAYAQYIACENKLADDSCGNCSSCKKYEKLIHPDLHFVYPVNKTEDEKKDVSSDTFLEIWRSTVLANPYIDINGWNIALGIEQKLTIINVEEADNIIKKLSLKSFEGGYKIMLMWMPERMNQAAANKLLKIIEEPPDKTLFLLVANNHEELLPTIVSRLQLIKIPRFTDNEIKEAIKSKFNLNDERAAKIAFLSDGSLLTAIELATINEEETENEFLNYFIEWMRMSWKVAKHHEEMRNVCKWAEKIGDMGREQQKSFLKYCLYLIRESMLLQSGVKSLVRLSEKEMDFIKNFALQINIHNSLLMNDALNKAYNAIERNANGKILFLDLSFKVMKMLRVKA
ncbi:MAG: ATP-binding protein [Bacteroidia bacterium]